MDADFVDVRATADVRLAELKDTSSCPTCGAREPTRIEGTVCNECAEFPRCYVCTRWVGDGSGWLPGHVLVLDENGNETRVCDNCWKDIK
jgi:hypothetical protein